MSFLYPRTVAFNRPAAQSGVGAQPYGGQVVASETVVVTAVRASIQERREGTNNPVGLPGDAMRPTFYVFIPKAALALGVVLDRDIMIDDLGQRYQVVAPYWDSLGYRLTVLLLET
jgi:hypothetical protein